MLRTALRPLLATSIYNTTKLPNRVMSVEVAIKCAASSIGEGPHWDAPSQTLLHVDILTGDVHRWDSVSGVNEKINLGSSVGMVVPRVNGGYVVGLGQSLAYVDWDSLVVTKLHGVQPGVGTRFNDGKCDATGRLWAGTMGHETSPAKLPLHLGQLYSLEVDGALRIHKDKVSISNGLAWTADNKTMYYIDSIPRKVYAYDFDLQTGTPSNERVCVDFGGDETLETLGYPDGMTIDTEDKIWVACYGVGKVVRFDPQTGKEMLTIDIPARRTTSCCFGGKNMDELFVTSSRFGMSDEEMETTPLAGSVFRVTGLGCRGLPGVPYRG